MAECVTIFGCFGREFQTLSVRKRRTAEVNNLFPGNHVDAT